LENSRVNTNLQALNAEISEAEKNIATLKHEKQMFSSNANQFKKTSQELKTKLDTVEEVTEEIKA
jgi:soluble cytochrome b562